MVHKVSESKINIATENTTAGKKSLKFKTILGSSFLISFIKIRIEVYLFNSFGIFNFKACCHNRAAKINTATIIRIKIRDREISVLLSSL